MTTSKPIHVCSFLLLLVINLSCNRPRGDASVSQTRPELTAASERALVIRPTQSPADGDSREPELTATQDGRVILSWVEKTGEKRYALRTAFLGRNGWTEAETVSQGENWFVNWADFPSVIALKDSSLAAHWLVKSGSSTYAYDVNISQSKDGGKSWTKSVVPHRDNTQTEHGFVSLAPTSDGVAVIWLDSRKLDKGTDDVSLMSTNVSLDGKVSGEIEILKGDFQVNIVTEPGAVFGEMSLLLGIPHMATVRARKACQVRVIADGDAFLRANAAISYDLLKLMAGRLHGVTNHLTNLNQYIHAV